MNWDVSTDLVNEFFLSQSSRDSLLGFLSTSFMGSISWGPEGGCQIPGNWVTGGCELLGVGGEQTWFLSVGCIPTDY